MGRFRLSNRMYAPKPAEKPSEKPSEKPAEKPAIKPRPEKPKETPKEPESTTVAHCEPPKVPEYCVDNQLVESRQNMEIDTRIKVRTKVEFTSVDISADCICIENSIIS